MSFYELTLEDKDRILESMTEEQREFAQTFLIRGRRTLFAQHIAGMKSRFIPDGATMDEIESYLGDWDYIGFIDSGERSSETKCECGAPLRYQHHVLHRPTNTIRYLGINHLELHTGIDAKIIHAIMKGFDVLDAELNEILHKFDTRWQLQDHVFQPFPKDFVVPTDINRHLKVGLPLLDRQIKRLRQKLREWELSIGPVSKNIARENKNQASAPFVAATIAFEEPVLFHLTEGIVPSDNSSESPAGTHLFELPVSARQFIDQIVNQHKHMHISARSLSEALIEHKLVSDSRMQSGKPDSYIAVCFNLDQWVEDGKCKLTQQNSEDRIYYIM